MTTSGQSAYSNLGYAEKDNQHKTTTIEVTPNKSDLSKNDEKVPNNNEKN